MISCSHADIGRYFPDVIWHTEVPLLRTGPVPLFLLSRLVREHGLKVVLTGEGADEFLCGYNIFKETKVRHFWSRQPDSAWRPALLRRLYGFVGDLSRTNESYLRRFFGQGLTEVDRPAYSHMIRWRNSSRGKRLFSAELRQRLGDSQERLLNLQDLALPADLPRWRPLARAQYLEGMIFLAGYLLASQGDRMEWLIL